MPPPAFVRVGHARAFTMETSVILLAEDETLLLLDFKQALIEADSVFSLFRVAGRQ